MTYIYTNENRLLYKHNYMYSKYLGKSFLEDYLIDRRAKMKHIENFKYDESTPDYFVDIEKEFKLSLLNKKVIDINEFTSKDNILVDELLLSLINQISLGNIPQIKLWLNLLIQRFEVSKKLFCTYKKDLKKGSGDDQSIERYINLSLVLIYVHHTNNNLQYLSTALKINDLILSALDLENKKYIYSKKLNLLINAEISKIIILASKNNINL